MGCQPEEPLSPLSTAQRDLLPLPRILEVTSADLHAEYPLGFLLCVRIRYVLPVSGIGYTVYYISIMCVRE